MKKKQFLLSIIIIFLAFDKSNSQSLNIDETISYINTTLYNKSNGVYFTEIELSNEGILKVHDKFSQKTYTYVMHISDVEVSDFSDSGGGFHINCKWVRNDSKKCIENNHELYHHNPINYKNITIKDLYVSKKLYNAFKYLFELVNEDGSFVRKDEDPFSPNNFGKTKSIIINNSNNKNITLNKVGGVYELPVTIGSITKKFILDSGASDVLISEEIEKHLISSKIITQKNYLSPALYKIADGSVIVCRRLILPEIKTGNYIVKNVVASINSDGTTLLLGKSFLDKFQSWSIDNNKQILKLEK